MELRYKTNAKILLFAMIGAIMACSSFLIFSYNPLQMIIKKVLVLKPGSIFFGLWSLPDYEVFIKVYIFNVTNEKEFLDGREKLNFQQVGPYVYNEILKNTNGTINDNGTLTFIPQRFLVFRRDLSIGDPDIDRIISPNIPLVGIQSSLKEASMFTNLAISTISNALDSKPILNLTINEYLWGYDDRLVTLAHRTLPNWINFERFGILDRLMALDNATNIVTLNLHPEYGLASSILNHDEQQQIYHIHRWNGSPGLKQWGYVDTENNETLAENSRCNMVEGSFEGTIFPPNLKINSSFKLYRRAFCRPVAIHYESQGYTEDGFEGFNYRLDQQFLSPADENPENACYCPNGICLPKGLGTLSPCYYDMPIVISQPHFLNSDPILRENVNGMNPNKSLHDTVMTIHSQLGVPLKARLRIQINLDVGQTKYNSRTRHFNDLVLPLFWLEMEIDNVPTSVYIIIKSLYHILPVVQEILIYALGIFGLALVSGSALVILFLSRDMPNGRLSFKSEYSPIPVIPIGTQYFKPEIRVYK